MGVATSICRAVRADTWDLQPETQHLHLAEPRELRASLIVLVLLEFPDSWPSRLHAELGLLISREPIAPSPAPGGLPQLQRATSTLPPSRGAGITAKAAAGNQVFALSKPKLQRSATDTAKTGNASDRGWTERWDLPDAELQARGHCHIGALPLRHLEGLRDLVGQRTALTLRLRASDGPAGSREDSEFFDSRTQAFTWGSSAPLLLAVRSEAATAELYGQSTAAIIREWATLSVCAACYLHNAVLAFYSERCALRQPDAMLSSLVTSVLQGKLDTNVCVATAAIAGQLLSVSPAVQEMPAGLWDLVHEILRAYPVPTRKAGEKVDVPKPALGPLAGDPPWLATIITDPVERISILQHVRTLLKALAQSESRAFLPSYKSYRIVSALPEGECDGLIAPLKWPPVEELLAMLSDAMVDRLQISANVPGPPELVRGVSSMQVRWKEVKQQAELPARAVFGSKTLADALQSLCATAKELANLEGLSADDQKFLESAHTKAENMDMRFGAAHMVAKETLSWLEETSKVQKKQVERSRKLQESLPQAKGIDALEAVASTLVDARKFCKHLYDVVQLEETDNQSRLLATTGGRVLLLDSTSNDVLTLIGGSGEGFQDGDISDALVGDQACGLAVCNDRSILLADPANHRIRWISADLKTVGTLAGTGARSQLDGRANRASFSRPNSVIELKGGAIVVTELGHPETVRIIEDGMVTTVSLPLGKTSRSSAQEFILTHDASNPHGAWIVETNGICRLTRNASAEEDKQPASWTIERVSGGFAALKGISGLLHIHQPSSGLDGLLMSFRAEYRVCFQHLDSKPKRMAVVGQAAARGFVDGIGKEARFMAPERLARLADGSLALLDGAVVRRIILGAEIRARTESIAAEVDECCGLALQRAKQLNSALGSAVNLVADIGPAVAAYKRRLCEGRFGEETNHLRFRGTSMLSPTQWRALVLQAPSISSLATLMVPKAAQVPMIAATALGSLLQTYDWPTEQSSLRQDLVGIQLFTGGPLLPESAVIQLLDNKTFAPRASWDLQLMAVFEGFLHAHAGSDHLQAHGTGLSLVQLAILRWLLRRYVKVGLTQLLRDVSDSKSPDAQYNVYASWAADILGRINNELEASQLHGETLVWLLREFIQEHVVGDSVDRQAWAYRAGPSLVDGLCTPLRTALLAVLRHSAERNGGNIPLRRALEALDIFSPGSGINDQWTHAHPFMAAQLALWALEAAQATEKKKDHQATQYSKKNETAQSSKKVAVRPISETDYLVWAYAVRWVRVAPLHAWYGLDSAMQIRMESAVSAAKAVLGKLQASVANGTVIVETVQKVMNFSAGSDIADGLLVLELLGGQGAEDSGTLREIHVRLTESKTILDGLAKAVNKLWPSDPSLLTSIDHALQKWKDLEVSKALGAIAGEPGSPILAGFPREVLLSARALSLLGTSDAFCALWQASMAEGDGHATLLRRVAKIWMSLHEALGNPQSNLQLTALDPVARMLQRPEELRKLAVTGNAVCFCDDSGAIQSWNVSDPTKEWETGAMEVLDKFTHTAEVRCSMTDLRSKLDVFGGLLLTGGALEEKVEICQVLDSLEPRFVEWQSISLADAEDVFKLASRIDERLIRVPEAVIKAIDLDGGSLLSWLRTLPDDADYLVRIEIALGRVELEVPEELWSAAHGRVDEQKVSALTAVRTALHMLIYRPSERYETFEELLTSLSSLDSHPDKEGLAAAVATASRLHGPLKILLGGGGDAAVGRLCQLVRFSEKRHALWSINTDAVSGISSADGDRRPADERLLRLAQKSEGRCVAEQGLAELLDFQAAVSLSTEAAMSAAEEVAIFNEHLGAARHAATVISALENSGHPNFQHFKFEFLLSRPSLELRAQVSIFVDSLKQWNDSVSKLRRAHAPLNFLTAKQLGMILKALVSDDAGGEALGLSNLLHSLSMTWGLACDVQAWSKDLRECWSASKETASVSDVSAEQFQVQLNCVAAAFVQTWSAHGTRRPLPSLEGAAVDMPLGADLTRGVHVTCVDHSLSEHLLLPYLVAGRLPGRHEVLLCHELTPSEAVELLLLRWAQDKIGSFYTLGFSATIGFEKQQMVVRLIHEAFDTAETPKCPLLVVVDGVNASDSHVASQLAMYRVHLTELPPSVFSSIGSVISGSVALRAALHKGQHSGCGKSFSIRLSSGELGCEYKLVRISGPMSATDLATKLAHESRSIVPKSNDNEQESGGTLLHLDLVASTAYLDSDTFTALLFDLLVHGFLSEFGQTSSEQIFDVNSRRVALAFEVSAAGYPSILDWLPQVQVAATADCFHSDNATLLMGMGSSFSSARHDGLRGLAAPANAHRRLQYVCRALELQATLRGAFPLQFEPNLDDDLPGDTCFNLLVNASGLKLRPSLWNLWAFVDVLYWQFSELHHPESVANQACIPEKRSEEDSANETTQPGACPMFKGELIAFVLRTARDFATRQVARGEDLDPDSVVAAELSYSSKFHGRWRRQNFSSDGQPVFAYIDGCGVQAGYQYFLYYRALEDRWVIDEYVDKVAPAYMYTRNSDYRKGWYEMGTWELNKQMRVRFEEHPLSQGGKAVRVSGVDEFLKGGDDEYCPPLNGIYLRQPKSDDVNKCAHYVLEEPRRHLFWDPRANWCIAHVCHAEEGTYATSQGLTVEGQYWTMGRDRITEVICRFITAKDEVAEAVAREAGRRARRRQQNQQEQQPQEAAQVQEAQHEEAEQAEEEFMLLRWEDSPHDCMLFSNSSHAVCFLSSNPKKLRNSMHPGLVTLLERNKVTVGEDLNSLTADHTRVLGCLTDVLRGSKEAAGLLGGHYCLTGDAVLKMLAIYVRMRCGLPVVLMGECGCGKTELVRFLCAWLSVPLLTLNVHGGTTENDIDSIFSEACTLASTETPGKSATQHRVIVFLDEVNTSHHVRLLCETILHRSLRGNPLPANVDVLAALNPRRKRPPEMQLTSGLVYGGSGGVEEEMSQLVYRVHSVPETIHDFLFDFGALTVSAEEAYVRSMANACWPGSHGEELIAITSLLCNAQAFIRRVEGDPSAVSLRDVKRCLRVAAWMQERYAKKLERQAPHVQSLVVAIGLVYHYRLTSREMRHGLWLELTRRASWPRNRGSLKDSGWEKMSEVKGTDGMPAMESLLLRVQNKVATEFEVDEDVVMNEALSENVFVGFLCIMNRIPLFIVGKPGTSKTLCMQVLLSNLQGMQSKSKHLRNLPAIRLMQYQCSPLSTAEGIERQFDAAQRFAASALDAQVVLLLDEVGLAEFSPDMPLKVLHGILADPGDVAVVGLSNWRLDPAKMNRSVCLARPDPDAAEVGRTGVGLIGSVDASKKGVTGSAPWWLSAVADAFWNVFTQQGDRDWLGMRDYYSFVRALKAGNAASGEGSKLPSREVLLAAAQRNFSGRADLVDRMLLALLPAVGYEGDLTDQKGVLPLPALLHDSFADRAARHLLIASSGPMLSWLEAAGIIPADSDVLMGSDFPEDASEAYAVKQLTRVRDSMARGRTLILWRMDTIYEALYDVLNQRYVQRRNEHGHIERMLRLAIGARSQLCQVASGFKLAVLVEVEQAHNRLDVPFLNRFEKQLLTPRELLTADADSAVQKLVIWVKSLVAEANVDVFPGFDETAIASLVLSCPQAGETAWQTMILAMANPLAVFRSPTLQQLDADSGSEYFKTHADLASTVRAIVAQAPSTGVLCDIYTSSPCAHMPSLSTLGLAPSQLLVLSELSGEPQLIDALSRFFDYEADAVSSDGGKGQQTSILFVQADLLAGGAARLALLRRRCVEKSAAHASHHGSPPRHVFVIQHRAGWPAPPGGQGFAWRPEPVWRSVFVDDLRSDDAVIHGVPLEPALRNSVHQLVQKGSLPLPASISELFHTVLARCLLPAGASDEAAAAKYSSRLISFRSALEDPCFVGALETAALHVLEQWGSPDASGLHLHVRLAMRELRAGSLRHSIQLAIDRLLIAALAHAVRWLDADFNMVHLQGSKEARELWFAVATEPGFLQSPQLTAVAASPGAALGTAAPMMNNGRHGILVCKCPFSQRLLSLMSSARTAVDGMPGSAGLRSLCGMVMSEKAIAAFADFNATCPGALLHDAVAILAPTFPGLTFSMLHRAHLSIYDTTLGGEKAESPLDVAFALWHSRDRLQSLCSILSMFVQEEPLLANELLDRLEALDVRNAALDSKGRLARLDATIVETVAKVLMSHAELSHLIVPMRVHVRTLVFAATSTLGPNSAQFAQPWWRLQLSLIVSEELHGFTDSDIQEFSIAMIPESDSPLDLLDISMWSEMVRRIRQATTGHSMVPASFALWRGVTGIVDEALQASQAQFSEGGTLLPALWSLVSGQHGAAKQFHLDEPLEPPVLRGLLHWLLSRQKASGRDMWQAVPPLRTGGVALLISYIEDVATQELCVESDQEQLSAVLSNGSTEGTLPVETVCVAARVRYSIAVYVNALLEALESHPDGTGLPSPPEPVLSKLLQERRPLAMFAAKVLRRVGGDEALCKLASLKITREAVSWLPFDPTRFPPNDSDRPDPFVHYAPDKKRYLSLCSAVGVCSSSTSMTDGEFESLLEKSRGGSKLNRVDEQQVSKWTLSVLAAMMSRAVLHRELTFDACLKRMLRWTAVNVKPRLVGQSGRIIVNALFSGQPLLPHLEDIKEQEAGCMALRGLLEQLAAHLILVALQLPSQRSDNSTPWLQDVMLNPQAAQKSFWPSMPDSEEQAVLGAMGYVGWYVCPNGHPYSVGECTRPMQLGTCPVKGCGASIGGQFHEPVKGVKRVQQHDVIQETVQKGYVAALGHTVDQTIVNQRLSRAGRPLTLVGLKALRIVLHLALWVALGLDGSSKAVEVILPGSSAPGVAVAARALYDRLRDDWRQLQLSTRFSSKDLGAFLHLVMFEMRNKGAVAESSITTLGRRFAFEEIFQHSCERVQTMFNGFGRDTCHAISVMNVGNDYTATLRAAVTEEDWFELCDTFRGEGDEHDAAASVKNIASAAAAPQAMLWRGRTCMRLADFERAFAAQRQNKDRFPLIAAVVREQQGLAAVSVLPSVLAWHAVLFEAFDDFALTREDAREVTNAEAIARLPEPRREEAERILSAFCSGFNIAFPLVRQLYECQANPFLQEGRVHLPGPMSRDTPVSFSLPFVSTSGETEAPFLCTVQLVSVLQTVQNELVETVNRASRSGMGKMDVPNPGLDADEDDGVQAPMGNSTASRPAAMPGRAARLDQEPVMVSAATDPAAVAALLVSLDPDKVLAPRFHCFRSQGMNFCEAHDLARLERSLWQEIRSASRLQVQLRHYRFAGEVRSSGRLALLRNRIAQESLPPGTAEALQRDLARRGAEAGAQLRALIEDAIHLCLSLGGASTRSETPLAELVDGLLASGDEGRRASLPQVLRRGVCLAHLQALYLELERGPDGGAALAGVALAYRQPLDEPARSDLEAALQDNFDEFDEWLPVLHDFLTEQLVSDRWPTDAPLADYLGFAAGEDPPECFPESLELRHALEVHQRLARRSGGEDT